jgi:hypothetical protein
MPGADERRGVIHDQLTRTAAVVTEAFDLELQEDAKAAADRLLEMAAVQIIDEGLGDDDQALRRAEASVMRVLVEAGQDASTTHGFGGEIIRNVTARNLEQAFRRLCPGFWPFC